MTLKNYINLGLGILGLLCLIIGISLKISSTQKDFILIGTLLLTLSAILEKNLFFSLFQAITLCGVLFSYISTPIFFKFLILAILASVIIAILKRKNLLSEKYMYFGVIGLIFLSFAYASSNALGYFLGGFFITLFSYIAFKKGFTIGIIYCILNLIYTLVALVGFFY